MEVDLYQRHGMYGLGVVDPATGLDSSAPLVTDTTAPVSSGVNFSSLSNLESTLSGQSPYVVLGLGALGLWILSSIFSGTKRTYEKVARPIKRRRKRRQELEEAEESYHKRRKSIERAYSK
jgi:hypothetical protein